MELIDWLVDWLIGWLIDWLVGWSIDWLIDCLIAWLVKLVSTHGQFEWSPAAGDIRRSAVHVRGWEMQWELRGG